MGRGIVIGERCLGDEGLLFQEVFPYGVIALAVNVVGAGCPGLMS